MWPILGGTLVGLLAQSRGTPVDGAFLAGLGIVSWLLGLRWYGMAGMGLRGGRPLFAGIGFAFLGWALFLIARLFVLIEFANLPDNLGQIFFYTLVLEAFCVQLWTFGTLYHGLVDWLGGIGGSIAAGVLFGAVGFLFFAESTGSPLALLYFVSWGLLYAFTRLRTGSLVGIVLVQAMHTLTAWSVLPTPVDVVPADFVSLYVLSSIFYLIIVWRLWPRQASDIRL